MRWDQLRWRVLGRRFLAVLLAPIALAVLLYLLAMIVSWNDATLSPAAQRLTASYLPDADPNNAYFSALGLLAPPGASPFEEGLRVARARHAWAEQRKATMAADQSGNAPVQLEALFSAGRSANAYSQTVSFLPLLAATKACQKAVGRTCIDAQIAAQPVVGVWADQHPELAARLRALVELPKYDAAQHPWRQVYDGTHAPHYFYAVSLALADASALWSKGETQTALAKMLTVRRALERQARGSRSMLERVLRGAQDWNAMLASFAAVASEEALRTDPAWPELLAPWPASWMSLETAMRAEHSSVVEVVTRMPASLPDPDGSMPWFSRIEGWLSAPLFCRNETLNDLVAQYEEQMAVYRDPLRLTKEAAATSTRSTFLRDRSYLSWLRNAPGKVIADVLPAVAVGAYASYFSRIQDDVRGLELARAVHALRIARVRAEDMSSWLSSDSARTLFTPQLHTLRVEAGQIISTFTKQAAKPRSEMRVTL